MKLNHKKRNLNTYHSSTRQSVVNIHEFSYFLQYTHTPYSNINTVLSFLKIFFNSVQPLSLENGNIFQHCKVKRLTYEY